MRMDVVFRQCISPTPAIHFFLRVAGRRRGFSSVCQLICLMPALLIHCHPFYLADKIMNEGGGFYFWHNGHFQYNNDDDVTEIKQATDTMAMHSTEGHFYLKLST